MTREEKIRWLQRYRNLEKEIAVKRELVIKLRSESERTTSLISDMPKGKNGEIYDRTAETVAKIADAVLELNDGILRLLTVKKEIEEAVSKVENGTYRVLLLKRYIECKKWENIAVEMNYSWKNTHRIHNKAIMKLTLNDTK